MNNPHSLPEIINRHIELEGLPVGDRKLAVKALTHLKTELQSHDFAIWVSEAIHLGEVDFRSTDDGIVFTDYEAGVDWLASKEKRLRDLLAVRQAKKNSKSMDDIVERVHEGGQTRDGRFVDNMVVVDERYRKGIYIVHNVYRLKRLIVKMPK